MSPDDMLFLLAMILGFVLGIVATCAFFAWIFSGAPGESTRAPHAR